MGGKILESTRLVGTLLPKRKYLCHYRNLQFYIRHGLVLEKIHRVVKFRQSSWLKSYIDHNTVQRQQATSVFGKNFFKLMSNAFFGKTMEGVRKRLNVILDTSEDRRKLHEYAAKPNFKNSEQLAPSLLAIIM